MHLERPFLKAGGGGGGGGGGTTTTTNESGESAALSIGAGSSRRGHGEAVVFNEDDAAGAPILDHQVDKALELVAPFGKDQALREGALDIEAHAKSRRLVRRVLEFAQGFERKKGESRSRICFRREGK